MLSIKNYLHKTQIESFIQKSECEICDTKLVEAYICSDCKQITCPSCCFMTNRCKGYSRTIYKCSNCISESEKHPIYLETQTLTSPEDRLKIMYQRVHGDKRDWTWHFCVSCQESCNPNNGVLCKVCDRFLCDSDKGTGICPDCQTYLNQVSPITPHD